MFRRGAFALAAAILAACGAGGNSRVTSAPSPSPTKASELSSAAAMYVNLSLKRLMNYAKPTLPAYYASAAAQDNTPATDPVTDAGATLGRVMFNDRRLSSSDTISCASCHQQAKGFTDSAQFSIGAFGTPFRRAHAMRLANLRYYASGTMFWERSMPSVESQAVMPMQDIDEMGWGPSTTGMSAGGLPALEAKMARIPYYPELFAFVYGDPTITTARIQAALAQYERSMISTHSRWDTGYAKVYNPKAPDKNLDADLPNFTAQENRGRHLFMTSVHAGGAGCAACHQPPTYALDAKSLDNGLEPSEATLFKSPSLKNVGITGPYMHDGRFRTLADVVAFYSTGVHNGPLLDPRMRAADGGPLYLHLNASDRAAIVAFLMTLDDPSIVVDPRYTSPFKR